MCGLSPFLAQRPLERPTTQSAPQSPSWDVASSCLLANICSQAVSPSGWRRRPGRQHVGLNAAGASWELMARELRAGDRGPSPHTEPVSTASSRTCQRGPPWTPSAATLTRREGHTRLPTLVPPPSVSHRQFRGTGCIGLNQWPFCRTAQSLSRETVPGAPDGGGP